MACFRLLHDDDDDDDASFCVITPIWTTPTGEEK